MDEVLSRKSVAICSVGGILHRSWDGICLHLVGFQWNFTFPEVDAPWHSTGSSQQSTLARWDPELSRISIARVPPSVPRNAEFHIQKAYMLQLPGPRRARRILQLVSWPAAEQIPLLSVFPALGQSEYSNQSQSKNRKPSGRRTGGVGQLCGGIGHTWISTHVTAYD